MRFRAFCSIAVMIVAGATGHAALADHRYVARDGVDGSGCGASTAPCKSLALAISEAAAGDKIICRDAGGSGPLIINKGLEIDCSSARQLVGGNTSTGGSPFSAIIIDTSASAVKTVRIRGLGVGGTSVSFGLPAVGIYIKSATAVFLEDVVVSDTAQIGVQDVRTGGQTKLFITDSIIRNIGGVGVGIGLGAQGPNTNVLDNVRSEFNGYGIAAATGNNVQINRSVFSGNSTAGIEGDPGAQIAVDNSVISHNDTGVQSNSSVRLFNNHISFNSIAITGASASLGQNRFSGNSALGTAPTPIAGASANIGP